MTDTQPTDGSTTRLLRVMREFVAAVLWAYIVVKLAVFDIDLYIVQRFSPRFVWLLNLKVFVLIGLSAIAWVVLGRRQFPLTILYILAYPLVVIFWRVPQVAFRRWPLFIAFAPGVYRAVRTFRHDVQAVCCGSRCRSCRRTWLEQGGLVSGYACLGWILSDASVS